MEGAPLCVRTSVIVFPSIGNWPVFVCFGTLHIIEYFCICINCFLSSLSLASTLMNSTKEMSPKIILVHMIINISLQGRLSSQG